MCIYCWATHSIDPLHGDVTFGYFRIRPFSLRHVGGQKCITVIDSLGPRRSGGGANGGAGLMGEKKRAPGIHCMRMREQRWNSTAAVLFLVMIVHVINIHIVDSSQ